MSTSVAQHKPKVVRGDRLEEVNVWHALFDQLEVLKRKATQPPTWVAGERKPVRGKDFDVSLDELDEAFPRSDAGRYKCILEDGSDCRVLRNTQDLAKFAEEFIGARLASVYYDKNISKFTEVKRIVHIEKY